MWLVIIHIFIAFHYQSIYDRRHTLVLVMTVSFMAKPATCRIEMRNIHVVCLSFIK